MNTLIAVPGAGEPGVGVNGWGAILFMAVFAIAGIYLIAKAVKMVRGQSHPHHTARYSGKGHPHKHNHH